MSLRGNRTGSQAMQFSIYQESRRGSRRSNQDRIACCTGRNALLLLLADGLSVRTRGKAAAGIAMQFVTQAFRREARPALADPCSFLRRAITGAHQAIIDQEGRGLAQAPRTTCVACVVQSGIACWAHVGNSRLYHVRDGCILARTTDHSRAQQLIDQGRMREGAFAAHAQRKLILNCLGSPRPPQVELSQNTRLETGDTLMLCSDGLWGPLSPGIISSALQKQNILQAIPELLDEAERRAGHSCDNLSVIALSWE